tara:strand:+ start:109 stop:597 length:489 start_codon:yes stop_codon:yes gene_type:complete
MASILKVNTIQDATNSNTAISVDSSGRMTTPAVPAFHCTKTSSQTASSDDETVLFQQIDFDNGSNFANNTFTVPIAGIYFFSFKWLSINDTNQHDLNLCVNGTAVSRSRNDKSASSAHATITINYLASLSVNDAVTCQIDQNGKKVYGSGNNWTTFMGYLVG